MSDEDAIRAMIETWMEATRKGDLFTLLGLMTDDVIFTTVDQPPFGKAAFAAGFNMMLGWAIDARSDIQEIQTFGEWGYVRNHIHVSMTPRVPGLAPMDKPVRRSGPVLSVVCKRNGRWLVHRDANMMKLEVVL